MRLELAVVRVQVQLDRIKPGLPPARRYTPAVLREVASLRVDADGVIGVDADGSTHLDVHHVAHPHSRNAKGRNGISIMTTGDYAALRARYGAHLVDGIAGESVLLDYAPGLAHRSLPDEIAVRARGVIRGSAVGDPATGDGGADEKAAARVGDPAAVSAAGRAARTLAAPFDAAGVSAAGDPAALSRGAIGGVADSGHAAGDLALTGVHIAKPCVAFTNFCLGIVGLPGADDAVRQGLKDLDDGARGYKMAAAAAGTIGPGDVLVINLSV